MIKKGSNVKVLVGKDKNKTGDRVSIIESKPFSKNKKFQVMGNVK